MSVRSGWLSICDVTRRPVGVRWPGSVSSSGSTPSRFANWVAQAEVDEGHRPGVTTAEQVRIVELEREVRELRRANHILKTASAFFAAELDRPASM